MRTLWARAAMEGAPLPKPPVRTKVGCRAVRRILRGLMGPQGGPGAAGAQRLDPGIAVLVVHKCLESRQVLGEVAVSPGGCKACPRWLR